MPTVPSLNCWQVLNAVLGVATRVLLYGPPGTGKSRAAANQLASQKQKVWSMTLTPDTPMAEVRGHYIPQGHKGFVWQDGPMLTGRYRTPGGRLVLNEVDLMGPDVEAFITAVCDDDKSTTITLPTGEVLTAAANTEIVATMNGDPFTRLPARILSRFPVKVYVDRVHPDAIALLPEDLRGPAEPMMMLEDSDRRIDLRAWLAYADLRAKVDPAIAAIATFGDRAQDVLDAIEVGGSRKSHSYAPDDSDSDSDSDCDCGDSDCSSCNPDPEED